MIYESIEKEIYVEYGIVILLVMECLNKIKNEVCLIIDFTRTLFQTTIKYCYSKIDYKFCIKSGVIRYDINMNNHGNHIYDFNQLSIVHPTIYL